jgi:hypothetical protein
MGWLPVGLSVAAQQRHGLPDAAVINDPFRDRLTMGVLSWVLLYPSSA